MNYAMNLKDKYFKLASEDLKSIEVRLLDEKRKQLLVGDTITFCNKSNYIIVKITNLTIYNSFEDLLKSININKVGFIDMSYTEALDELYSIYPRSKSENYSILSINFTKMA